MMCGFKSKELIDIQCKLPRLRSKLAFLENRIWLSGSVRWLLQTAGDRIVIYLIDAFFLQHHHIVITDFHSIFCRKFHLVLEVSHILDFIPHARPDRPPQSRIWTGGSVCSDPTVVWRCSSITLPRYTENAVHWNVCGDVIVVSATVLYIIYAKQVE